MICVKLKISVQFITLIQSMNLKAGFLKSALLILVYETGRGLEDRENSYLYLVLRDEQNTKLFTYHQLYSAAARL